MRGGALAYEELLAWAEERIAAMPQLVASSPEEPLRTEELVMELHEGFLLGKE